MYMCDIIQCFVTHFKVSHFNFYCVFYLDINKRIPIEASVSDTLPFSMISYRLWKLLFIQIKIFIYEQCWLISWNIWKKKKTQNFTSVSSNKINQLQPYDHHPGPWSDTISRSVLTLWLSGGTITDVSSKTIPDVHPSTQTVTIQSNQVNQSNDNMNLRTVSCLDIWSTVQLSSYISLRDSWLTVHTGPHVNKENRACVDAEYTHFTDTTCQRHCL